MSRETTVWVLLERHGMSFSEAADIDLTQDRPATVWSWYLTCLLLSARISSDLAIRAARAYLREIGRSVRATERATWEQRVQVLNANGYARYDERTSAMLGDTAAAVRERYGGDLRRLRDEAGGDPDRLHGLLQQFKGVGRVGANIFCREMQVAWDELYPFIDGDTAQISERLGLGRRPETVLKDVARQDVPRLLTAMLRAKRADDLEAVRAGRPPSPGDPRAVLERLSYARLRSLARDADLAGRSRMNRDELLAALSA
ncbi:MAG: hypothetical protein ACOCT8_03555 [Actinomycetota bacterium]